MTSDEFSFKGLFHELDLKTIISLLTDKKLDLTGCLTNCSNRGLCGFTKENKLSKCLCHSDYFGSYCHSSKLSCLFSPCLNNGTCIDEYNPLNNKYEYKCKCSEYYNGKYCDKKIDLCKHEQCSNHGVCVQNKINKIHCDCLYNYHGNKCQHESDHLQKIKIVKSTSLYISIFIIVSLYLIVILNDIFNLVKFLLERKTKAKQVNALLLAKQNNQ